MLWRGLHKTVTLSVAVDLHPAGRGRRIWLLLAADYRRLMRSRAAWLLWALVAYTVLFIPFILNSPQEEFTRVVASWIGPDPAGGKMVLFIWIDVAMNKLALIMGAVLASGIIVDEKARGSFDLLLSKPVPAGDYFIAKLGAALAAMATFYLSAAALALLTFPWRVQGFPTGNFVALSSVHLFAALFSVTFAGMAAAVFGNRLVAMLVTIIVIGLLVGLAFFGFYHPTMAAFANVNPFFHGVKLLGRLENYSISDLLQPIVVLLAFNLVAAAIGCWRAIALIEKG